MSLTYLSLIPGRLESLLLEQDYIPDPLLAYRNLCADSDNNLLLESAEAGKPHSKSMILVDAALKLVCNKNTVSCFFLSDNGKSLLPLIHEFLPAGSECESEVDALHVRFPEVEENIDEDYRFKVPSVFDFLRLLQTRIKPLRSHPQAIFLGGVFGYDLLENFEPLPEVSGSVNSCPDYVFYLAETLIYIDHTAAKTEMIGTVFSGEHVATSYFKISQRLDELSQKLNKTYAKGFKGFIVDPDTLKVNKTDLEYSSEVAKLVAVAKYKIPLFKGF